MNREHSITWVVPERIGRMLRFLREQSIRGPEPRIPPRCILIAYSKGSPITRVWFLRHGEGILDPDPLDRTYKADPFTIYAAKPSAPFGWRHRNRPPGFIRREWRRLCGHKPSRLATWLVWLGRRLRGRPC